MPSPPQRSIISSKFMFVFICKPHVLYFGRVCYEVYADS